MSQDNGARKNRRASIISRIESREALAISLALSVGLAVFHVPTARPQSYLFTTGKLHGRVDVIPGADKFFIVLAQASLKVASGFADVVDKMAVRE